MARKQHPCGGQYWSQYHPNQTRGDNEIPDKKHNCHCACCCQRGNNDNEDWKKNLSTPYHTHSPYEE